MKEWLDKLSGGGPIPDFVLAGVVILLGFLVGRLLSSVAVRLLRRWSHALLGVAERFSRLRGVEGGIERADAESAAVRLTGRIVFWIVFAVALAAATAIVGVPVVSTWLARLAEYLPQVLAAAAIVLTGLLVGHLLRVLVLSAAAAARFDYARALARVVQVAVVVIAVVVAIEELGIEITFLIVISATVLATVLGGVALAFGLGAGVTVGNMVACHYLARSYRVGHVVRIGGHQGRIVAILPSAVLLSTPEGRVMIPAGEFARSVSVLVEDGS
jgi:hypothetical protein